MFGRNRFLAVFAFRLPPLASPYSVGALDRSSAIPQSHEVGRTTLLGGGHRVDEQSHHGVTYDWKKALLTGAPDRISMSKTALARCHNFQEIHIRLPPGPQGAMVGRSCVKASNEIRDFKIQEPMDWESAIDYGGAALQAWGGARKSATPLDARPTISTEDHIELRSLCGVIPLMGDPYSIHQMGNISESDGAESFSTAAHRFISKMERWARPSHALAR